MSPGRRAVVRKAVAKRQSFGTMRLRLCNARQVVDVAISGGPTGTFEGKHAVQRAAWEWGQPRLLWPLGSASPSSLGALVRVAELAQLPRLFRCEPLPVECMQTRTYTSTRAATSTCCTTCTTCTPTAHRPTPSHSPFPDFVRPPALRAAGAGCARGGNAPWSAHDGIRAAREPRSVPQATCALRRCRVAHARWARDVQCRNSTVSAHLFSEDGLAWHTAAASPCAPPHLPAHRVPGADAAGVCSARSLLQMWAGSVPSPGTDAAGVRPLPVGAGMWPR
jgi:hypothetical protein